MLRRFCLYGFLKNQTYFEPFLVLALLEKGATFTWIGLLIGFREICINVLEIPTGSVADVLGRRRAMIASHLAYIGSFLLLGLCQQMHWLFVAMFLFSIGEAFRTGTHKAIIFDWLTQQNRAHEKTRTYGLTRSYSKLGSALSAVIAAILVFVTRTYSAVFLWCLLPYLANIVNFLTYPKSLDGPRATHANVRQILTTLQGSLKRSFSQRQLRRLLVESMAFEGLYKSSKDYVQPVLKAMALSLPVLLSLTDRQRTAVCLGGVYVILHLLGSLASRHAHLLPERLGGDDNAARRIWLGILALFVLMGAGLIAEQMWIAVVCFVGLAIAQNFWRPLLVSRVADHAPPAHTATILSIESQAKTLFTAIAAPLIGLAVDNLSGNMKFLPIALLGILIASTALLAGNRPSAEKS